MIDILTYNDLLEIGENERGRMGFVLSAIRECKGSEKYRYAEAAEKYYDGENPDIYALEKVIYDFRGLAHRDMFSANHKISSSFFGFVVNQETSYLLANGVSFAKKETKKKLGVDFDDKLADLYADGAIAGVAFGFWNYDHLEVFKFNAAENEPGFVPLYDEENGTLTAGIRFWQIDDSKPLRATLYELDGYTEYIKRKDKDMEVLNKKRPYMQTIKTSAIGGSELVAGENYPTFPIVPFRYTKKEKSKLRGKKNTLIALDLVTSNMVNNVDEGNLLYWVLTNCGGMDDMDDMKFLERLKTTHIVHADGDDGAKAEPHSIEAPYAATDNAIETLSKRLYDDFQAFDPKSVTAGNQTATAIKAGYTPLDLAVDSTEKQLRKFIFAILRLAGVDDYPTFNRNRSVMNTQEETETILMGADYYDEEYVTKKLLAINGDIDQYDEMMKRKDAEAADRYKQQEAELEELRKQQNNELVEE